jgi:hypothetical protein
LSEAIATAAYVEQVLNAEHQRITNRLSWLFVSQSFCITASTILAISTGVPIVADGAFVAFTETRDETEIQNGMLVVAWVEGRPLVRWFATSGQFALLRAENPAFEPNILPIDLKPPPKGLRFHRVLGISTPH